MSKQPEELQLEAEQYLNNIKLYASHWGKALLIGGGTVYITYRIIKAVVKKKNTSADKDFAKLQTKSYALAKAQPSSRLFRLIKQQISIFLIAIAKQKIAELMNRRKLADGK